MPMRNYIAIVVLFAAIAITTTGFAGQRVDSGPPVIESLHSFSISHDFMIAEMPFVPGVEPVTTKAPNMEQPVDLKVFAHLPLLFAIDKVGWRYADFKLTYDFNHWKEQIRPLLSSGSKHTIKQGYPLLS